MGQSLSNEAGQATEVDGDGPWKRESDQETYRGRGEADPAASQPLPDPREVAKRYTSIVTIVVSVAVCEIFSVKQWCNLENGVRVRSR